MIILRWIYRTWDVGLWTGLIWLRIGRGECVNGPSGSIQCGEFLTSWEPVSFWSRALLHGVSKYVSKYKHHFLTFCWPCIAVYLSQYLTNLMHKICFTIIFSSCLYKFRAHRSMNKNLLWNKFCASSWLNTEINICAMFQLWGSSIPPQRSQITNRDAFSPCSRLRRYYITLYLSLCQLQLWAWQITCQGWDMVLRTTTVTRLSATRKLTSRDLWLPHNHQQHQRQNPLFTSTSIDRKVTEQTYKN